MVKIEKRKKYETKNVYLASWLLSQSVPFSHTDLDNDERTRFHFDDFEKAKEMTKKFYDDVTMRNFLDSLQKVKSLANSTRDQSDSIPK